MKHFLGKGITNSFMSAKLMPAKIPMRYTGLLATLLLLTTVMSACVQSTPPPPASAPDTTVTAVQPSVVVFDPPSAGNDPNPATVDVTTAIHYDFSDPLDPNTISQGSFFLISGIYDDPNQHIHLPVNGKVSYSTQDPYFTSNPNFNTLPNLQLTQIVASFTPDAALAPGQYYSVLATKAITNVGGTATLKQFTAYHFKTTPAPVQDTTPPTVSQTSPVNGETNVGINRSISVTFSEPVQTVDINTFIVEDVTSSPPVPLTGTVTLNATGTSATFTPDPINSPLQLGDPNTNSGRNYTVTLKGGTTGVTDLANNPLTPSGTCSNSADYCWSFTTPPNTTTIQKDTIPPNVSSVTPRNNAVDVVTNTSISATFDEALDPASVYGSTPTTPGSGTFTVTYSDVLSGVQREVFGTVSYSGTTAVFKPDLTIPNNAFPNGTHFTVRLVGGTNGITDLAKNPLTPSGTCSTNTTTDYCWGFDTVAANNTTTPSDTTPPTVTNVSPANGATGVAYTTSVSVDFSEALDPATINTASFLLTSTAGSVAGTVSYNGTSATFKPAANLAPSTIYTATLTSAITDLASPPNALVSNYAWSFKTADPAAPVDNIAPYIVDKTEIPALGAVDVRYTNPKPVISVGFSEALNPSTVSTATFKLTDITQNPPVAVAGSVLYSGTTATFTPNADLAPNTTYAVTFDNGVNGITDLAGNQLATPPVWQFTTAAPPPAPLPPPPPPPSPVLQVKTPTPGSQGNTAVAITTNVKAQFDTSIPLDPSTVTSANVTLTLDTSIPVLVSGSVQYSSVNNTITFTPSASLAYNSCYYVNISSAVTSLAGAPFVDATVNPTNPPNKGWYFATELAPTAGGGGPGGGGGGGGMGGGGGGGGVVTPVTCPLP